MCDLCTSNKKVFTHEHELFPNEKAVQIHKNRGDDRPGAIDQSGFRGHPRCSFCNNRHFYGEDELNVHCREAHERCFICDRITGGQPQYFENFESLNAHFNHDHFACNERECIEKRFVAFSTELDLKAHQLAEHGSTLSKDIRRDVQTVSLSDFNYRQPFSTQRGSGNQRDGRGRGRGRDPNAEPIPSSSAQPLRRDEVAFQRQMAIHTAQSISTRTFGGQLTASTPAPRPSQSRPSSNVESATSALNSLDLAQAQRVSTPQEQARELRHRAVVERASNLVGNDEAKMSQFRHDISAYRNNSITAESLISQFFDLFSGTSRAALGTLIREIAELYEDPKKSDSLRSAWNNWRAINEDYPSLPASGPSTSSSIPLNWAVTTSSSAGGSGSRTNGNSKAKSTRVLKLKSSTAQSSRSRLSQNQSWGTATGTSSVVSSSSSRDPTPGEVFPGLSMGPSRMAPSSRPATVSTTSWVAANSNGAAGHSSSAPTSRPASRVQGGKGVDAFPALPKAQKPMSTIMSYGNGRMVRRDMGAFGGGTTFNPWGGNTTESGSGDVGGVEEGGMEGEGMGGSGKGKKKGNKGKKVLMNWG